MTWLTKTLTAAVLAVSFTSYVHGETCLSDGSCRLTSRVLTLNDCGITDADIDDLEECFDSVGRDVVSVVYLNNNELTAIPSDLFEGMSSVVYVNLKNNVLNTLDADLFDDVSSAGSIDLSYNALTTLPAGIFEKITTPQLKLGGNDLQCLPAIITVDSSSKPTKTYGTSYSLSSTSPIPSTGDCCACTDVATCDTGLSCNPGVEGYTCEATVEEECVDDNSCDTDAGETCSLCSICEGGDDDPAGASGDPHMTGFRGQKFDFTGKDGAWYALVSDLPYMHVNMRVTSPVPSVPEITYITGTSIVTADADGLDHSIVISVKNPHSMESSCAAGVPSCLADGALHVVVDGVEVLVTPGEVSIAPGVAIAAVNLPGACRSFGFELYWERKKVEYLAQPGRGLRLTKGLQDMSDWVVSDPTATNMVECAEYVARATAVDGLDLFAHESEHVSFQIMTPTAVIRLSHGRLHQLPMRDPTDQFDLPDHLAWQMNLAIDHSDMSIDAKGILGETLVPTLDKNGAPIMQGMEAIRGTQEDYRVGGPLGVFFPQGQQYE